VVKALEALGEERGAALKAGMLAAVKRFDVSDDDTLLLRMDYLEAGAPAPIGPYRRRRGPVGCSCRPGIGPARGPRNVACASRLVADVAAPRSYATGVVMPAISADTVVLPRVPEPDPTAADRPVRSVTTAPSGLEGEGFPVRRAFAGVDLAALDPFVHMDQMGEVDYAPGEPKGTPWHPHRGFETVTYMIDGTFQHQDSNGGGGLITDGDTQWMTAGAGLSLCQRESRSRPA
jgi:hypothetical protein